MKRLIAILLAAMLALSACAESGAVLGYLTGGQKLDKWIDEALAPQAGSGADHTALAIAAIDRDALVHSAYGKSLIRYMQENNVANPATRLRIALTLVACGEDKAVIEDLLDSSAGQLGIMSDAYALLVIANGYSCKTADEADILADILSLQLADGGWAISGTVSDADTTAIVLQALAAYDTPEINESKERALRVLSGMQTENGGYRSYGAENCESACQVLIALTALGIDPMTDAAFIKNGHTVLDAIASFRLPNGGYSHVTGGKENTMAARQALLAYAAYEKYSRGEGALYRFEPLSGPSRSLKFYLNIGLTALCIITVVILLLTGKRRPATFLCTVLIFAAALLLVNVLDIKGVQEYYTAPEEKSTVTGSVSVEIKCDNIIGQKDTVPADGCIFAKQKTKLHEGDTAASILRRVCKENRIQLDMDNSMAAYISGIGYLYEFEFGPLSGWIYKVNGERLSVGCGEYEPADGDILSFLYTLNLGEDCE